jgi:diaminohydroxyphosphoribosylaminopyrimidine deaminase/5-amino-6-(5-phosphoribosylamino)uracil reductase
MAASLSDRDDSRFMAIALDLARPGLGRTTPNPTVGCVIVKEGRVIGRGATAPSGRPHAERIALDQAGAAARGATAYVSFEPCSHQGQTPPCAVALIEAGVQRVVVGCLDPYPPVRGRGIAKLRRAGIAVKVGVLEQECRRLNEGFILRVTRGRPLVILKLAITLDGRIAAPGGDSRWVTGSAARGVVHRMRTECDAVMVGAGTVRADNPRLTARIPGGRDPIRVIVDGRLRAPADARVFVGRSHARAILFTARPNVAKARRRIDPGRVDVVGIAGPPEELSMVSIMRELGRRGLNRVMIEGGAFTAGSALRHRVVDRVAIFMAPRLLGGGLPAIEGLTPHRMRDAIRLDELWVTKVGDDLLIEGAVMASRKSLDPKGKE